MIKKGLGMKMCVDFFKCVHQLLKNQVSIAFSKCFDNWIDCLKPLEGVVVTIQICEVMRYLMYKSFWRL